MFYIRATKYKNMRKILVAVVLLCTTHSFAQAQFSSLQVWDQATELIYPEDWLIRKIDKTAGVYKSKDGKDIIISNGLLKRSFRIHPNLACIDFRNLSTGEQLLRAVNPEAKLTIDGKIYGVGGLYGQKEKAYLKSEWINDLTSTKADFQFFTFKVTAINPYINWKQTKEWMGSKTQPTGKTLILQFHSDNPLLKGIIVNVNYELYDGIPLLCKWISIENKSQKHIKLNRLINEILSVHEEESSVAGATEQMKVPHGLYVESNYAFNNSMNARLSDQTTHWKADTTYTSQVNYALNTPCLLEVYPPVGPGVQLQPAQIFKSIRTYELLLDGFDRERNGLAQRKMYRKIAPWVTENPIFMHLTTSDPQAVKSAIDQCAVTGYEALIMSFLSGFDMEDTSETNIKRIKDLVDYGHSKGVLIGGYSLLSSRKINNEEDVIDPKTGKADVHATFGHAPCLGSKWGLAYLSKLRYFMERTGLDIFENDGAYPGDVCASLKHPGHKGLEDSQWAQMELQKELYRWCCENGIYVNAPDWYLLDGSNKVALGYREVNFSLPRAQQIVLNRQNIYDGTWEKTPSMSWGFVPLTEYHGGGAAATLEPLSEHLDAYRQLMVQYYGAGIQACYRGQRLFDTDRTKKMVSQEISWYKKYRNILNADIIHLRRPDAQDWDGILHVDPYGKQKGLAMLYNPLDQPITRKIRLPLYYTGLTNRISIREKEGKSRSYKLTRDNSVFYELKIPANSYTWLIIE
jgi:hypothetical protein